MLTVNQTLVVDKWLKDRVTEIKDNVDKNFKATGKTRDSIAYEILKDVALITGSDILQYGEYGRGPTTTKVKGPKTVYEAILEWIKVKNIAPWSPGMTEEGLAAVITKKIHEQGIKVPNKYNKGAILTSSLNEVNYQKLRSAFTTMTVEDIKSDILRVVNNSV